VAFDRAAAECVNDFAILRRLLLVVTLIAEGESTKRHHRGNGTRVTINCRRDEPLNQCPLLRDRDVTIAFTKGNYFAQFFTEIRLEITGAFRPTVRVAALARRKLAVPRRALVADAVIIILLLLVMFDSFGSKNERHARPSERDLAGLGTLIATD
jgi:hypothetical protein